MYRLLFALAFLSLPALALTFPEAGRQSVQEVKKGLADCGLQELDAYDPRLPRPQVPVDTAFVNKNGVILAYFIATYGLAATETFKAPNGSSVHWVTYRQELIEWGTPHTGTVAHGNRFLTLGGMGYNLYCRSALTNFAGFQQCVQQQWVNTIVGQLCRFSGR